MVVCGPVRRVQFMRNIPSARLLTARVVLIVLVFCSSPQCSESYLRVDSKDCRGVQR